MPLSKYFHGHGDEVMSNMKKEYGDKKGESVFYGRVNKLKKGKRGAKAHKSFGFGK